ncbi:MAG: methylenetetrahydrofolate reductase [NAD(P)H] [Verrucomicrobiota bacterium JB023]|nr:methylenetetrahydrofolate reductase [NAD(P)H] [Verrucomicrobiota bacterium JB023]
MHIQTLLEQHRPSISFEFFPPKTPSASEALFDVIKDLASLEPSFVSVTYGAGGSTRELTHDLVLRILQETSIPATPHLTCVQQNRAELAELLGQYQKAGVSNILALRGDPPRNQPDYDQSKEDFPYASDLVSFIKDFGSQSGQGFGIGVAGFPEGHPETPNRLHEMDHLKAKVDQGADYICTQLFFDNHDLLDFRDRCEMAGIRVPIIAGIMPVTSRKGMIRMADLAAGARFPAKLQRLINEVPADTDDITPLGIDYAHKQCEELLKEGIPGIHFYTLNKSRATLEVVKRLRS